MKTLSFWKKSVYSAIIFFGTVTALTIGYGALFGGLTVADKVGSGSGLTATAWNRIVDGVLDINTRLENLSFSGGSVGIGTTGPSVKLDVNGATNIAGQLRVTNGYNSGAVLLITPGVSGSATKIWTSYYDNESPIVIGTYSNNTNQLYLATSGNVGIGTTNPQAKLEVNGDFIRTIARAQGHNQVDDTDNGAIATRTLTFVKKQADTGIRVTYSDGRRVYSTASAYAGGRWEAKFNAASCANPGPLAWDVYMSNVGDNHHRTDTTIGTCFGLATGTYTIQIYVGPPPGYTVFDLYTGWIGAWSLEAEEVR